MHGPGPASITHCNFMHGLCLSLLFSALTNLALTPHPEPQPCNTCCRLPSAWHPLPLLRTGMNPMKPAAKPGVEEGEQVPIHRIRITLTSTHVKNLERGEPLG